MGRVGEIVDKLQAIVDTLPLHLRELCKVVLSDPEFAKCPGGASHHHNYEGGLAQHTWEVAAHAVSMTASDYIRRQLIVAAVFHDYGKIFEYVIEDDGSISRTPFIKQIGHVVWGWHYFLTAARDRNYDPSWCNEIGHALLAHHGRKEWGSPVEPATPLAYILHSADMLSSRGVLPTEGSTAWGTAPLKEIVE